MYISVFQLVHGSMPLMSPIIIADKMPITNTNSKVTISSSPIFDITPFDIMQSNLNCILFLREYFFFKPITPPKMR